MEEVSSGHPPIGHRIYWRFAHWKPAIWKFGYVTQHKSGLVRMGLWTGDYINGPLVSPEEVEWRYAIDKS